MANKHHGGRGRRSENKYQTITISLPPHLKSALDGWVTSELSRSEIVAMLVKAQIDLLERGARGGVTEGKPEGKNSGESAAKPLPITTVRLGPTQGVRVTPLIPLEPGSVLPTSPKKGMASNPREELEAPSRPSGGLGKVPVRASMRAGGVKRTATERLAQSVPVLNVMQRTVPRGLGWKPERYDQTDKLLEQGDHLMSDGVNYRTVKGEIMNYKTAEALVRLGVLTE